MPYRDLNFDTHNVAICMSEVKDMFRMHFDRGCQYVMKRVYAKILAVDFDSYINAGRYQRSSSRRSYRNGYRHRKLVTSIGELDLEIPRDRDGGYRPELFERHKRVDRVIDDTIRQMFLSGVSTRKVGDVLDALCGSRLSASYVSQVTKELDSAVREYGNSPIDDDFKLLFLDGLSVKVRMELKAKRYMLLVAYGVRADGSRRLISFQRVKSESYACWKAFLGNLQTRGLLGKNLELITMDGAPGLWAAIDEIYPLVRHQLCWVHKLRNVSKYCARRYQKECMEGTRSIMYAPTSGLAAKRFREWKRTWQEKVPRAVKCLEDDFDRLIPVFEFPEEIRKMIRTTNVIERCFREVRRRLKVMGYFQNSKSCDRIIFALFSYFNSKWKRNNQRITAIRNIYRKAA